MTLKLPASVAQKMGDRPYEMEEIGMSGAKVAMMADMVLKIEPYSQKTEEMVQLMRWLEGKLPVPKVLDYAVEEGMQYLLMSRISGSMACDGYYLEHSDRLLALLCRGLEKLWSVDISACPRDRGLDKELREARARVEQGLVSPEEFCPAAWGGDEFETPEALLLWLEENRPRNYEPVFSHGDYCLPNVFLQGEEVLGFIDLGDAGIADRWRDIALCYRSLKGNFDGSFGGKVYPDFHPDQFLAALSVPIDREKLRYYLLLEELF